MNCRWATFLAASLLALTAFAGASSVEPAAADPSPSKPAPAYTADGKLKLPEDYREWVFLSSGLDMSYSEKAQDHSMFDNVFVDPVSYRAFLQTGTWPDRTQLVLETRGAAQKGSINRRGKFQTSETMGLEVHVKDTERFPGGWAFFSFQSADPARQIPTSAACYACHQQHGAVDTTFTQFYPTLLSIAMQKHTLAPGYRP
jgi:Cytochrome P460